MAQPGTLSPTAKTRRGAPCAGCRTGVACDYADLPALVEGGDDGAQATTRAAAAPRMRLLCAKALRFVWGDRIARLKGDPPRWLVRGQYDSALSHLTGTPAAMRAAAHAIYPLAVWLTQQYGLTPHHLRFTRKGACEMTLRRDPFSDSPQAPDNFRVSAGPAPAPPPPPPLSSAITWELFVHRLPGGQWAINGTGAPVGVTTGQVFQSLRPIGICLAGAWARPRRARVLRGEFAIVGVHSAPRA